MDMKGIARLRRAITPKLAAVDRVFGCYCAEPSVVTNTFSKALAKMGEEEVKNLLEIMRKAIGGKEGMQLSELSFPHGAEEQKLFQSLCKSTLSKEADRGELFSKIVSSLQLKDSKPYAVLLMANTWDIPPDGDDEDSEYSFSYILGAVCPLKAPNKSLLNYTQPENDIRNIDVMKNLELQAPVVGFMYPSYEAGGGLTEKVVFYNKDKSKQYNHLVQSLFGVDKAPASVQQQKENFSTFIAEAMEHLDESKKAIEFLQNFDSCIRDIVSDKEVIYPDKEPLLTVTDINRALRQSGANETMQEQVKNAYVNSFGENARVNPGVIIEPKNSFVCPGVTVRADPAVAKKITTQIIDGQQYLLIPFNSGEANGVNVKN